MAEQVWTTGKLTPVFSLVGRNSDDSPRYRRAPFDVLVWAQTDGGDSELYVNTLGFESLNSASINDVVGDGDAINVSHEFGWYTPTALIVDPHDGNGNDDTWVALHTFGYV